MYVILYGNMYCHIAMCCYMVYVILYDLHGVTWYYIISYETT